jgi:tetratricopeptide (TPR) repeat protein
MRPNIPSGSWKHRLWPTALLFGLPLILRLLCLLGLRGNPMFRLLVVDARTYHEMAAAIATGNWQQVGPFWQPPLYPYLLALLYKLTTPDPIVARIAQSVLGSISCLLIYRLGIRFFDRRAGWIAWGIAAAYGPFIFFDLQILNAGLVTFLLLLTLTVLATADKPWKFLAAGLVSGLAAITVATSLVTVPVFAVWLAARGRRGAAHAPRGPLPSGSRATRGWAPVALFLVATAVPVAIVTAVNLANCGEVVVISYNAGVNFWIGNNPNYERTVAIRPGRAWDALDKELRLARVATAARSSSYWFRKSFRWIGAHPMDWLRLTLRKTRLFLRGDEIWRNQEIYPFRQSSWILRVLLWIRGLAFPLGVLLPLSLAGMATAAIRSGRFGRSRSRAGRNDRDPETHATGRDPGKRAVEPPGPALLFFLLLAYSATVVAFFPAGRYRLPVVPWLILFAAGGMSSWIAAFAGGKRRSLALPLAVVLAGGLLSNAGLPAMSMGFNSDAYSDLGFSFQESGRLDEARRQYETALRVNPNNMEALNNLGTIFLLQGKAEDAKQIFRRVLDVYPDDRKALTNLGTIYLKNSEPYRAGYYYLRAQRSDPTAPNAVEGTRFAGQMADLLEKERMSADPEGFLRLLEGFFREEPQNDFLYDRLLNLLEGRGLYERELAVVRSRLKLEPSNTDLRLTATRLLERLGRPADARRVLNGAEP